MGSNLHRAEAYRLLKAAGRLGNTDERLAGALVHAVLYLADRLADTHLTTDERQYLDTHGGAVTWPPPNRPARRMSSKGNRATDRHTQHCPRMAT